MASARSAHFAHPTRNTTLFGVEPGMQVADFGAGSGHYVFAIAERLAHAGHVYAIDIQKDLLSRLKNDAHKRGYKNVEIIWADLERAGASTIKDAHLDLVLISNLLFQLELKEPPFVEALRILKPGGRLIVIDWSESFGGLGPTKKHVVKKDAAMSLAEHAGFKISEEFEAGAHHYGIVCVKPRTPRV
jgi:ubiquinone/menaquinone biosynthesis C-methylase UbiE